jgi:SagB-type dehydrogenase family enzyme
MAGATRPSRLVRRVAVAGTVVALALAVIAMAGQVTGPASPGTSPLRSSVEALPSPDVTFGRPLNAALSARRSVREFAATPLTTTEIGQLLWAAQGVTSADGRRTAPSAGALYPLEVYLVSADGLALYLPTEHALQRLASEDRRARLADAALGQAVVREAPAVIVITAVPERTAVRYGDRATRYVWLEAGHAAQNVLLEAVSLGLGAVPMGAFDDARVSTVLELPPNEVPLYLIPVGHPR